MLKISPTNPKNRATLAIIDALRATRTDEIATAIQTALDAVESIPLTAGNYRSVLRIVRELRAAHDLAKSNQ